jgi:Protein of unknown function (DUF559)
MAPTARVPKELTHGPFTLEDALRFGVTRAQLRGRSWRRMGVGLYAWSEIADAPLTRLIAAKRRLPDAAVFAGLTAAWLHGLDTTPCNPIEAAVPGTTHISRLVGVAVRRCSVPAAEISARRGLHVTSVARTVADLGCRLPLIEAVTLLDTAMHRRVVTADRLRDWVKMHPGYRGIRNLRSAIELAEPATESVMETRLRLVLVLAGLPRPMVQMALRDDSGLFIARPDLYYPGARLAVEYDGASHRDSLAADNRRQNRLIDAGYRILRFTAGDVLNAPAGVVAVVRRSLAAPPRSRDV